MYAIIDDRSKQYKVSEGDTLLVDLMDAEPGTEIKFDRVLMLGGDDVKIGTPTVNGALVTATVQGKVRGDKVMFYKFKRRKSFERKGGHRQPYTSIRITGIEAG